MQYIISENMGEHPPVLEIHAYKHLHEQTEVNSTEVSIRIPCKGVKVTSWECMLIIHIVKSYLGK